MSPFSSTDRGLVAMFGLEPIFELDETEARCAGMLEKCLPDNRIKVMFVWSNQRLIDPNRAGMIWAAAQKLWQ